MPSSRLLSSRLNVSLCVFFCEKCKVGGLGDGMIENGPRSQDPRPVEITRGKRLPVFHNKKPNLL